MNTLLSCSQLSKAFGNVQAVSNLTLSVHEGAMLTLLGASGCGKSTMLRLIAGFETPDEGTITVGGRLLAGRGTFIPPESRQIGMVFQDYALFPHLSVADNIGFGLGGRAKDNQARIAQMLALVGLDGYGKRMPHQLSGGQQQRVALARALAPAPRIVLLDEPFSNLDAALRKLMREEVRRILKETNTTAIFVTHDQEEALSLADVVAVMQGGRLLQIGTPHELYHIPTVRDVALFLGEANLLPASAHGDSAETPLGRVPLARAAHGTVEVMCRPEALQLTPSPNGIAQVIAVRTLGFYQLVQVRLTTTGQVLLARAWSHEIFDVGTSVEVRIVGHVAAF